VPTVEPAAELLVDVLGSPALARFIGEHDHALASRFERYARRLADAGQTGAELDRAERHADLPTFARPRPTT